MLRTAVFLVAMAASPAVLGQAATSEPAPAPDAQPERTVRRPTEDAVKSVWDYYYRGQGEGPVLVDARLCTDIQKSGPDKFECAAEVPETGVRVGTTVYVWQAYLVPEGDVIEDITVTLKQGDTVREVKDVKIKGEQVRARTWTGIRVTRPGRWTLVIARGSALLKAINFTAGR